MKIIKIYSTAPKNEVLSRLKDNDATNKNVRFDEKKGTPFIHVTEKDGKLKLKCEYVGRATKDNAFLEGTSFRGSIKERNGRTEISGVILTAPIFHLIFFAMFAFFVIACIVNGSFNVVPICLIVFDIFMYKDEFGKQGIIERYMKRAVRRIEERESYDND